MKRNLTFLALLTCILCSAQNITDALRYTSENGLGTARFQAMGGAFGALGGDLSSININPAGTAVFNNHQGTISGSLFSRSNTANYGGQNISTDIGYLDISQAGGVLVFKSSNPESSWNKIAIAFNYEMIENFNDEFNASGSTNEGIDNYFLDFAEGVPFGDIQLLDGEYLEEAYLDIGTEQGFADQQAFLGYFGGLIDPTDTEDTNTTYISNANYTDVNQRYSRITTGYNSKYTLSFASQFQKKIHFGASINIHDVLYTKQDEFTETGYNSQSTIQRTTFDNLLITEGSGVSLNLGVIAKLGDIVRLGASYQSPTWYRFEDNLSQRISSDLADTDINYINFDEINVFPKYTITTPATLNASIALVFGKNGLLSFDYGYKDMTQAKLGPSKDANFSSVNTTISNQLGTVSTLKLGGEYRINKISLRAGYRFEESPYKDGNIIGDLEGVSGGIGYNFVKSRLDFAINYTERDTAEFLFDTGINTPAIVNRIRTYATFSYTVNF